MLRFAGPFLCFLLLAGAVQAQTTENLTGTLNVLPPANLTLYGTARDRNSTAYSQVQVCWDDPAYAHNCDKPVTANTIAYPFTVCTSVCYGFNYVPPAGTVGSVTPRDGKSHLMYVKVLSKLNPGAGDKPLDGSPWPFTYKNGMAGQMWTANLEASPKRLTAAQLGLIANKQDSYSIGSSGTLICTVAGTAIKDDGVVGYYAESHHVPCSNIQVVSLPVQQAITQYQFVMNVSPALQAFPSGIQAIALGWVQPSVVVPTLSGYYTQSISGVTAHNGMVSGGSCFDGNNGLGYGPINPYFNTTSQTPYTDYGLRPTMMLAAEICPTCTSTNNYSYPWYADVPTAKRMINAAVSAVDTNPLGGNVDWAWTADLYRSVTAIAAAPSEMGNALSTMVNGQVLGSLTVPLTNVVTQQNILLFDQGLPHWTYQNATFLHGAAIGFAVTSTSGLLPYDGNQTNATAWIQQGAAAAFGNAVEPCELFIYKSPDPALVIPNYTQGQTAIEALWKSVRLPWGANFVGDPLAAPFRLAAVTGSTAPRLSSLSPSTLAAGTSKSVTLYGSGFTSPATVTVANAGIATSNVVVVNSTTISATITVASTVAPGTYNVSLTSSGQTTTLPGLTVVAGAPTLTGISPSSATAGTSATVTLSGSNFSSGATVNVAGSGVTASNVTVVSSTQISVVLTVAAGTAAGTHSVSVSTAAGTSGALSFSVLAAAVISPPQLLSMSPASGSPGQLVSVTLTGANFAPGTTVAVAAEAIDVVNVVVVNTSTIDASFQIGTNAALASHNVTVTNTAGTSNALLFTVQ